MNMQTTLAFYRATMRIIPAPVVLITRIESGAFKRTLKQPVLVIYKRITH